MRFKELTINSFFATLGSSGISVLMAALGYGVWSLVIPGLLGPIFSAVTLSVRARWAPRLSVNREAARRLSGFGMKFMVNNLLIHLKQQTSNFILGKLFGPSIVGLYNRALSTADAPRHFIGGSAYDALFRGLASMDDQPGKVQYIFLRSTTLLALYTMPCYVLLWWLADPGIVLLYGPKWEPSIEPLRILAISGFLAFGSAGALVAAKNRLGREIWINLETWALMIVAILVGAPFGMAGAAWAVLAVRVYGTLRINRLALRTANVKWMTILRAVLPAYKVAGVMWAYMFVSHEALLKSIKADNPLSYVIAMALVGGAAYALAFLWGGSTELESEARRWKNTARRFTLSA
jgi:O-antigen/teichoic acid export membrane protein